MLKQNKIEVKKGDIENRENIGARTYNNYLCFFKLLFNWMIERDYISDNPFDKIRRKPKKLTKKKRRVMTDGELNPANFHI